MNRRKSLGSLRRYRMVLCAVWYALVAVSCGGGGGSAPASSGGTVNVALASIPQISALAQNAGIAATDPLAQPSPADDIDQAWITIRRVALLPGSDESGPDPSGEPSVEGDGGFPGMIAGEISPPVEVDLLDLPQGQAAFFLNAIENVPAGTYGKIRLFYTDPKVHFAGSPDNSVVHPTANYHMDIHFKGGDLVIPVATGREGGVIVYDVTVVFAPGKDGLKITVNPNKILMRPQVFATVGIVQFVVSGVADNVNRTLGTFDIATAGGRSFHAEYDVGTDWFFRDSERRVPVSGAMGPPALNDTALVDVLGIFPAPGNLLADDILITFPLSVSDNVVSGDGTSGWNTDNTFTLDIPTDNVVYPKPDRFTALYDNAVSPFHTLDESYVVKEALVTVRGYPVPGGIDAYWISIVPGP